MHTLQSPETSGSNPGSKSLSVGSCRNICTLTAVQPDNCGLHTSAVWMDNLSPNDRFDLGFMDVGSVQQHCIIGRVPGY